MGLKWPFFITSLGIAAAGAKFVRKHETQELNSLYVGSWKFSHPREKRLHTITIYPDLSIILDGSAIIYQLIELSEQKLAIQDQFGYHLIIKTKDGTLHTLYDELDDISLPLVPTTLNPQKEGVPIQ
ncbi:MAG: DUF4828 domain-containing protein [Enterococcus viikkiensis]